MGDDLGLKKRPRGDVEWCGLTIVDGEKRRKSKEPVGIGRATKKARSESGG